MAIDRHRRPTRHRPMVRWPETGCWQAKYRPSMFHQRRSNRNPVAVRHYVGILLVDQIPASDVSFSLLGRWIHLIAWRLGRSERKVLFASFWRRISRRFLVLLSFSRHRDHR